MSSVVKIAPSLDRTKIDLSIFFVAFSLSFAYLRTNQLDAKRYLTDMGGAIYYCSYSESQNWFSEKSVIGISAILPNFENCLGFFRSTTIKDFI
jgi:hypothetical protein